MTPSGPSDFFAPLLAELHRDEAADPEPAKRFVRGWHAWQRRHWRREQAKTDLREAQSLTRFRGDPAPLVPEGLAEFLSWVRRQDLRFADFRQAWSSR